MRRMLDPKTIGGGNTTPARHGYMVVIDYILFYVVLTAKDYAFKVGQQTEVGDIKSDEYKELYQPGYYPCGGYIGRLEKKILASTFQILNNDTFKVSGLDLKDPAQNMSYNVQTELSSHVIRVVKLF